MNLEESLIDYSTNIEGKHRVPELVEKIKAIKDLNYFTTRILDRDPRKDGLYHIMGVWLNEEEDGQTNHVEMYWNKKEERFRFSCNDQLSDGLSYEQIVPKKKN